MNIDFNSSLDSIDTADELNLQPRPLSLFFPGTVNHYCENTVHLGNQKVVNKFKKYLANQGSTILNPAKTSSDASSLFVVFRFFDKKSAKLLTKFAKRY